MGQSRERAILRALGLQDQLVEADSLNIEPHGEGWKVRYTGFGFLSDEQLAALTAQAALGSEADALTREVVEREFQRFQGIRGEGSA